MKKTFLLMFAAATSLTTISAQQTPSSQTNTSTFRDTHLIVAQQPSTDAEPEIIPKPVSVKMESGHFRFNFKGVVAIRADSSLLPIANYLSSVVKTIPPMQVFDRSQPYNALAGSWIELSVDPSLSTNDEGYKLTVSGNKVVGTASYVGLAPENKITIVGKTAHGVFNGVQTLLQLLPPEVLSKTPRADNESWLIPEMTISDEPRFQWRGLMLDCGRYFHSVDDIKKLLDVMALLKLNVFHWHLTEDQGWRLAINQYPLLTSVGSWRAQSPVHGNRNAGDGKRYGGFYTQADAKEIVAYAAQRFITVVPEIEMPGHAAAAITAYPQLGNTDIAGYKPQVEWRWGVHPYIFAPKEETFTFLQNVLTEVLAIFPSQYIHIGGDEAPTTQWDHSKFAQDFMKQHGFTNSHQIQGYFNKRAADFFNQHGRRLIGWDEIEKGGLPENSTVMIWHSWEDAMTAINANHDVVIARTSNTYFDYSQTKPASRDPELEAIGGYLPLKQVYDFNPMPPQATTPEQQKHVLGVQGQLWSEYLWDWKKVEYAAFPRAVALAEVAWTPNDAKNYDDFTSRLAAFEKRLDVLGVNYYHSAIPASAQ